MYEKKETPPCGSGRTYDNAKQYQQTKQLNDIRKANLNYKNFDTGQNANLLSHAKKAEFYRERAAHQKLDEVKDVVGTGLHVAGTGLKVLGVAGGSIALSAEG